MVLSTAQYLHSSHIITTGHRSECSKTGDQNPARYLPGAARLLEEH